MELIDAHEVLSLRYNVQVVRMLKRAVVCDKSHTENNDVWKSQMDTVAKSYVNNYFMYSSFPVEASKEHSDGIRMTR